MGSRAGHMSDDFATPRREWAETFRRLGWLKVTHLNRLSFVLWMDLKRPRSQPRLRLRSRPCFDAFVAPGIGPEIINAEVLRYRYICSIYPRRWNELRKLLIRAGFPSATINFK